MPDDDLDPGANTQMFRAFVENDQNDRSTASGGNRLLIVSLLLAGLAAAVFVGLVVL
jgi:hypothetical protein